MASSSPWSRLQFGIEQCEKLLRSRALQLWGCKDGESVVGFAALRPDGIEGEPLLEYICVDQEQRGKHVGSSLIEALEAYCKKKRDRNIYLFVSDFNLHAIRLYERLGYFRVGAIPDYNVYGQTEYLYRKALGEPRQQEVIREKHPGGLSKTQGASAPARDLNAGYARIEMPQRMLEAVLAASSAAFRNTGRDHPKDIDDELHRHILEFFCRSKPSQQVIDRTFSTFSGSIALDRVFGAIRRMHSRCESMQVPLTVILPEPSLDLWQQLLRDRSSSFSDVEVIAVRDFTNSRQRTRNIIDQVESVSNRIRRLSEGKRRKSDSMIPERKLMVLIDNPSNPQGFSMELQELQDLAKACKKHDAVMVLDHCFLLAGIHFKPDCRLANGFADLTEQSCDWYAMWDTGKSLDLAGDKVAFVTASSQYLAERLRDSLSVIQPLTFTAVRSLSVLVTLFENRDGILDEYLASAENLCSRNLEYLRRAVNKLSHCTVNSPAAGSFAILSCDLNVSSQDLATFWREEAGTGVALGKDFFAARFDEGRPPFVRLSLYKPASVFEAAVSTAASKWPAWVQRTKAVAPRRRIHRARPAD
jgi:aspartate/methionine/tyrosine aminotransferase/RimJ/RimL family protein N-acetyltransferase